MGAWSTIQQFFDRSDPLRAPMDDPFIQLDREHASRELRLKERGAEQGALELPSSDMQAPDAVEAEVAAFIQDHFERAQIDANNGTRTYDSRLASLGLLSNLSSITTPSHVAVSDFKAEVMNVRGKLSNSRDAIVSSYRELHDFRLLHKLSRPAHKPPPALVTIGAIGTAWLVEALINSLFLRLNDSMGWLGGLLAAGIVALINVGTAAFTGRVAWPLLNQGKLSLRVVGWLGIACWVVFFFSWNWAAAHYRDAKAVGLPDPEAAALTMLTTGLQSIYSYGFFVAGLAFAFISALAGYRMDDPFPGYGPVSKRHEERCERYVAEIADATSELRDIRDTAVQDATDVRMELGRQQAERQQIIAAREGLRRRYEQHAEQLEATANALLQQYRAANRSSRSTPAPALFNQAWKLPRSPLPDLPGYDIPRSALENAEASLERAVTEISQAFDEAIVSFEPLDELKRRISDA